MGAVVVAANSAAPGAAAPVTHLSSATPHAKAVAYAETLLNQAPVISAESVLDQAPPDLRTPYQRPAAANLVTRTRYWRSDKSATATYRQLKSQPVTGLRLSGYGSYPSSGSTGPGGKRLSYQALHRPWAIAAGDLFMEIVPRGAATSDVAAFAQVIPYPAKPKAEYIPADVRRAGLTRTARRPGQPPVTAGPQRLHRRAARHLAIAINRLRVQPPVAYSCPAPAPSRTTYRYQIVFRAAGHRWTVHYPAGCLGVAVRRGHHRLPLLESDGTLRRLLRGDWRISAD